MLNPRGRFSLAIAGLVGLLVAACPEQTTKVVPPDAGGSSTSPPDAGPPQPSSCSPCMISSDCSGGEVCAPISGDLFCVRACSADSDCVDGQTCFQTTTASGADASYCVETSGACSAHSPDAGGPPPDAGMSAPGSDAGFTSDVTADAGGTESQLYFAAVGDTRPPIPDDNGGYPTPIITQVFTDIQALNPPPPFAVGTGDYQYTSPALGLGSQATQLGDYSTARSQFAGVFWPAMGNHECGLFLSAGECNCFPGDRNSSAFECGTGTATDNYTIWFNTFIAPMGETNPYYSRIISATDGSWTAKFIFLALNYWDTNQQSWFQQQLASPSTTYTFVIHHENAAAGDGPPALAIVEPMEKAANVTLSIVGHTHLWQHTAPTSSNAEEVIVGNGGAPLDDGYTNYGYTTFFRQADGSIAVTGYDYQTNQAISSFVIAP